MKPKSLASVKCSFSSPTGKHMISWPLVLMFLNEVLIFSSQGVRVTQGGPQRGGGLVMGWTNILLLD